ncbi:hypothetical protein BDV25DRAFT_142952 [Aspergillus avenaceus]|uniref:Apple domain-containing protein n=1 Tax=Aspergillus avenaceus TaxID=36643 RepID=A0A5N6TLK6_ASPAV|nr:hypothetical protein BDV25DRAFT_142952 [Aspergillus avenaceus]
MRTSVLWTTFTSLSYFGGHVSADYTSDYNRLCPGDNPVTLGTVYTASCDKTLGPSLPVQKLGHKQSPTPEECAQVCEQDRSACSGVIWAKNACYISSDQNDSLFNAPGAVVLTPPPVGVTPEQLKQEIKDCETDKAKHLQEKQNAELGRENYKKALQEEIKRNKLPPENNPDAPLDLGNAGCNPKNHGKVFRHGSKRYLILYNHHYHYRKEWEIAHRTDKSVDLHQCIELCSRHSCATVDFYTGPANHYCYVYKGTPRIYAIRSADYTWCAAVPI